jgi:hypothetical protein
MFLSVLAFLAPALIFLEIQAAGRLFVTELLFISLLPVLWKSISRSIATDVIFRSIVLWCGLWLLAQLASDYYNNQAFSENSYKGLAKIAVFTANFAVLYVLIQESRRNLYCILVGLIVGDILTFYLNPSIFAEEHAWKFGVGGALTSLAVIIVTVTRDWRVVGAWGPWAMLIMGAANLYLEFRSLAAICIAIFSLEFYSRLRERLAIQVRPAVIVLVGVVSVWACAAVYKDLAGSGNLGEAAQEKYESQAISLTGVGLLDTLLGGRSELLVAVRAMLDAPILGHGSWAADYRYVAIYEYIAERLGADLAPVENDLIPSHSHLFGAWVESGAIGGLFFVYVLWIVGTRTFELINSSHPSRILLTYIGMMMLWDILFSPFAGEMRVKTALGIAVLLLGDRHQSRVDPRDSRKTFGTPESYDDFCGVKGRCDAVALGTREPAAHREHQ